MVRRAKNYRSSSTCFCRGPPVSVAVDLMLVQLGGALPMDIKGRRRYPAWGIV
jgi:hypothetical protein